MKRLALLKAHQFCFTGNITEQKPLRNTADNKSRGKRRRNIKSSLNQEQMMHALIVINLALYPFKMSALIDHTINIYFC